MKGPCFLIILLAIFSEISCLAQKSDPLKPRWITETLPQSNSQSYFFVNAHAAGASLDEARQRALVNLASRLEQERGLTIHSRLNATTRETVTTGKTGNTYSETVEYTLEVEENGRQVNIVCRVIDEYWVRRNGGYDLDVLYAVADRKGAGIDDTITLTTRYGVAGLLSIVPGVGQLYKGSTAKGCVILAGEALAAGGIILCENTRASYQKKMIEQPKYAAEYNALADQWETARNIAIGAAGAIYIYNLIDALVAPGARRIKISPKNAVLSVRPYTDVQGAGLSFNVFF